ncbi:MAG: FHS family L-fucose permease-like MFS transporter, partial [Parvicellaceae bacterium]
YVQSGFVQWAWFLAYFVFSIPAGIFIAKIGYKKGILLGLTVAGLGCAMFYPSAETRMFGLFLMSLFVLAGGITILQVAANPYVTALGSPEKASARLNLSQAFNSVGTTIAPVFGAAYLLSDQILSSDEIKTLSPINKENYFSNEASAVEGPFIMFGCALVVLAILIALVKLPILKGKQVKGGFIKALKMKQVHMGFIGIFLYVGAEVAIGSYLTNYFLEMNLAEVIRQNGVLSGISGFVSEVFNGKDLADVDNKAVVGTFVMFYWGSAMLGRFIGSFLSTKFKPGTILTVAACGAILMAITTISSTGLLAMWSALLIGIFNATMFPTIFSMGMEKTGQYRTQASGILCSAIVGGGAVTWIFTNIADSFKTDDGSAIGFKLALIIPILCYIYIAFFSKIVSAKKELKA